MEGMGILQPVVALAGWTMVMWVWMYVTRIPAMSRSTDVDPMTKIGGTGKQLDDILPEQIQWKAHNYNHLHEAPTVFYAIAVVLALLGVGDGMNLWLGWVYVGLRVLHSVVQATTNRVIIRFVLFALSTFVLLTLIFHAAIVVFDIHF